MAPPHSDPPNAWHRPGRSRVRRLWPAGRSPGVQPGDDHPAGLERHHTGQGPRLRRPPRAHARRPVPGGMVAICARSDRGRAGGISEKGGRRGRPASRTPTGRGAPYGLPPRRGHGTSRGAPANGRRSHPHPAPSRGGGRGNDPDQSGAQPLVAPRPADAGLPCCRRAARRARPTCRPGNDRGPPHLVPSHRIFFHRARPAAGGAGRRGTSGGGGADPPGRRQ